MLILQGAVLGLGATILMDIWQQILGRLPGQTLPNWAPAGRWFRHLPSGVVFHDDIARAEPYAHELALGWAAHYAVGILYGVIFALIVGQGWMADPRLLPAWLFGLAVIAAGWFLLQPGMGLGWAGSRTPNPAKVRLLGLVAHSIFGIGLYLTAPRPVTRRPEHPAPSDAAARRVMAPVVVYPTDALPAPDLAGFRAARSGWTKVAEVTVPPRDGRAFAVPAGHFFRVACTEGPQVGDLNLWHAADLGERFFSGKTRALHGTHVSTGDRLWSGLPHLRPMATITEDSLDWYGADQWGGRVHDVIGTRCDPYTNRLLTGGDYHHCCHSNLARALAAAIGLPLAAAEAHVHDVLNVFMCTGFTRDAGRYFMKASPARPGDFLELFAEIDLLAALSACPGGDCSTGHSSDAAACHPLRVEVFRPAAPPVGWAPPPRNGYAGGHGA